MSKYTSKFTGAEIDEKLSKVNQEYTNEEKTKVAALENYDDTEIMAAISELETNKANSADVYSKTETDNAIITKVAEIVNGAPEDFDTLKEMSDWLIEHEDSAASMNTAIQKNAEDIANRYTKEETDNKYLGKTETAVSAVLDSASGNIAEQFAIDKATIGMSKKNVLKNNAAAETKNGITFTVNDDGSISVKGTTSAATYYTVNSAISVPAAKRYILSGCPEGGGASKYQLYISGDRQAYDGGASATVYIVPTDSCAVYIKIASEQTVDLKFYPMLRDADIANATYEPYVSSVAEQLGNKLGKSETAVAALLDGAGNNIAEQFAAAIVRTPFTPISATGWYRVFYAEKLATSRTASIALNRNYASEKGAESFMLNLCYAHGNSPVFALLVKSVGTQIVKKIRIVYAVSTNNRDSLPVYIDVYAESDAAFLLGATIASQTVSGNNSANYFKISDFATAEIPSGYTSTECDLTVEDLPTRLAALESAATTTAE